MEYSASAGFQSAVISIFTELFTFLLPFIPLAIGFAVLVLYGMRENEDRKLALISTGIPAVLSFLLLGVTPAVLFLAIGLVAGGFMSTTLGEAYPKELEKMANFRSGSKAFGQIFLIVTILLTFGVFLQVGSNLEVYKSDYANATQEMASTVVNPESINTSSLSDEELVQQLPQSYQENLEQLSEEEREQVLDDLRNRTSEQTKETAINTREMMMDEMLESKGVASMLDLYIFLTILMVPGVLLFFRTIIFAPIAGLITLIGSWKSD
ncbi:MAG: hypothetical protein ACLFS3_00810 [Candidatus Aenigmatarchaeota archaeon]